MPKRDLKNFKAVAREFGFRGVEKFKFGDYIEDCKERGEFGTGPNGDFTHAEMREKAREFRGDDFGGDDE